ncbi:DUF3140 domain-containing protein [Methylobacterium sp. WL7]|uniref:DUF3140 domain-containing protein n=1 Tax=Methylobacterium sp. WL7 TaxID=2603900 RepID=UPI0011CCB180|nr:DUF3140 domain-containing protein [Methylobacterium sp. WL7]TXN41116.1 DUF3140 domain-containing protein [Methylobacterium sp. WL7]
MADDDHAQTWSAFNDAVNMTPAALRKHLDGTASREVGQKKDGAESTGHAMGRRILAIKDKKKADLTDDDYAAMRKVVGYVHRHLKQGGDAGKDPDSPWRMSLMNWGHDPHTD